VISGLEECALHQSRHPLSLQAVEPERDTSGARKPEADPCGIREWVGRVLVENSAHGDEGGDRTGGIGDVVLAAGDDGEAARPRPTPDDLLRERAAQPCGAAWPSDARPLFAVDDGRGSGTGGDFG